MWAFILLSIVTLWTVDILPFSDYWLLTPFGACKLIILHVVIALLLTSFFLATWTSPGHVPSEWAPAGATDEEMEKAKAVAKENKWGDHRPRLVRYCVKCALYKPLRTHHCSECKKCVLKMDHHCENDHLSLSLCPTIPSTA